MKSAYTYKLFKSMKSAYTYKLFKKKSERKRLTKIKKMFPNVNKNDM